MYAGGTYVTQANTNIPKIGEISLSKFYGATSAFVWTQTYSEDTFNANTDVILNMAGWDGETPVNLTINIATGIVISANTTGNTALLINNLPQGSQVTINNSGFIIGMGGSGVWGGVGGSGGTALATKVPTIINNLGTIGGGGGAGGGEVSAIGQIKGAGGGGQTGRQNSSGGSTGTFRSAGGSIDHGSNLLSGGGGAWGAVGVTSRYGKKVGGAGGLAVLGNSFITWQSSGTIAGAII